MSEKITRVRDYCDHCGGEGDVSECCSAEVDEHRCVDCGRFCGKDVCQYCEGAGYIEYNIGNEVDIFVCVWSEDYLTKQLHKPKDVDDVKTYSGKIVEFIDRHNAIVKVGKKKINVKIEDIQFR